VPVPRPRRTKKKYTPEEEKLLIKLKEEQKLAWNQIRGFFRGRSLGSLKVKHCTMPKDKSTENDGINQGVRPSL
ncbi:hypothetical protein IWW34DRAFT_641362, partial [Fusarium oxysporum f. sp. albedinis]